MSPSLLVYHFGTHEKLVVATLRWALTERASRYSDAFDHCEDLADLTRTLTQSVLSSPDDNRPNFVIYLDLVQYALRHPAFVVVSEVWRDGMLGFISDALRSGVASRILTQPDVDRAAVRIRAILEGHMLQWIQNPSWRDNLPRLRRDYEQSILAYLVAGSAAVTSPAGV